jgi:hypothetical protein
MECFNYYCDPELYDCFNLDVTNTRAMNFIVEDIEAKITRQNMEKLSS